MAGFYPEFASRSILRRCISCPDEQPTCPQCSDSETCVQKPGDGCNTCLQALCVPKTQASMPQVTQQPTGAGTNGGAIAGGVVGGVVFIAILTFLIWRFCIRPRYEYAEDEYSEEFSDSQEKTPEEFTPTSQARHSTHSVRSVASTIATRASNVIQIAFIPGITDRQAHDDNAIPPVPQIPEHQRSTISSTHSPLERRVGTPDHFFTPADLGGGSRWSHFSNETTDSEEVRSVRHQSLASSLARESVASTIYHDHQATPMSAAQGVRGRANVVSVRPSTTNTPGSLGHVPEVPPVDYFKYGDVKKGAEVTTKEVVAESPDGSSAPPSGKMPTITDAAVDTEPADAKKPSSKALAVAIEEATRRASKQPMHGGLGSVGAKAGQGSQLAQPQAQIRERDSSPFSDSHAIHTP